MKVKEYLVLSLFGVFECYLGGNMYVVFLQDNELLVKHGVVLLN